MGKTAKTSRKVSTGEIPYKVQHGSKTKDFHPSCEDPPQCGYWADDEASSNDEGQTVSDKMVHHTQKVKKYQKSVELKNKRTARADYTRIGNILPISPFVYHQVNIIQAQPPPVFFYNMTVVNNSVIINSYAP